jgi:hypothetical protein
MLLSQKMTPARAQHNVISICAHKVVHGGAERANRPVHTCGPLRTLSHLRRGAHSSSYDEASLKAEEISEGKHGMASRRILHLKLLHQRPASARPASGIALVTRAALSWASSGERRRDRTHVAELLTMPCSYTLPEMATL